MTLVSWQDVCTPKSEGGLGLRQMKAWNKASLAKHVWRICRNEGDLWTKWAKKILLKHNSIWQVTTPADCSFSWRKILKIKNAMTELIVMKVGDGRQTSLFYDDWLDDGRIIDMITEQGEVNVWG